MAGPTLSRVARPRRWAPALVGALLLSVLGLLLALQTRWLGELAQAQGEQTRRMLQAAAVTMVREAQATLAGVEEAVRGQGDHFDATAVPLVAEVYRLEPGEPAEIELPSFLVHGPGTERRLVVLDAAWLEAQFFPALARSALGPDGLETYRVAVLGSEPGGAVLYRSHARAADGTEEDGDPDASAELHLLPNRWRGFFGGAEAGWGEIDLGELEQPLFIRDMGDMGNMGEPQSPGTSAAPWRIELRHRAGSLALALARARHRNMLLGGGLLALLFAGFAFLWVAEQRARRLAERELAFVAGISHELRTPLAVVRTAASNLERGVVVEPTRVAEYGGMIEREATRVAALVERVLRFSGEDNAPLARAEVEVEGWVQAALERCRPWRDRKAFEVAVDIEPGLACVRGDEAALTSLLHNLIENAIKYGGEHPTVRVRARRAREARGLRLEVSDDGPGIASEDRARLFEPFFRGAAVRGGSLPGNGLGLGVARDIAVRHGGVLELVESAAPGPGAVFRLHLPDAPEEAGEAGP